MIEIKMIFWQSSVYTYVFVDCRQKKPPKAQGHATCILILMQFFDYDRESNALIY